ENLQGRFERMGALARNAMIVAGGAIGIFAKMAGDAAEEAGKFDAVFKEESAAATAFAKDFGDQIGRSERDLKSFLSSAQDTFVPLGFERGASREMSQTIT